ncbi:hypothetical protein CEXT_227831 [Caerostris extrusa]|uniref:Uncharacterized protein n=1 Tax=Caerostris extrusa TaxID=172846 RepID=A0AAV4NKA7_CAEEX|nr:hypothetical protein CEXT_227831 [Caerostris extrusa]
MYWKNIDTNSPYFMALIDYVEKRNVYLNSFEDLEIALIKRQKCVCFSEKLGLPRSGCFKGPFSVRLLPGQELGSETLRCGTRRSDKGDDDKD